MRDVIYEQFIIDYIGTLISGTQLAISRWKREQIQEEVNCLNCSNQVCAFVIPPSCDVMIKVQKLAKALEQQQRVDCKKTGLIWITKNVGQEQSITNFCTLIDLNAYIIPARNIENIRLSL